jgi:shikimate kinase
MQRTRNDTTRPLIQGKDPKNKIINLLKNRQRVYNEIADLTIETTNKDPKNIVMEIIENLEVTL